MPTRPPQRKMWERGSVMDLIVRRAPGTTSSSPPATQRRSSAVRMEPLAYLPRRSICRCAPCTNTSLSLTNCRRTCGATRRPRSTAAMRCWNEPAAYRNSSEPTRPGGLPPMPGFATPVRGMACRSCRFVNTTVRKMRSHACSADGAPPAKRARRARHPAADGLPWREDALCPRLFRRGGRRRQGRRQGRRHYQPPRAARDGATLWLRAAGCVIYGWKFWLV